jgi:hypothetical protein
VGKPEWCACGLPCPPPLLLSPLTPSDPISLSLPPPQENLKYGIGTNSLTAGQKANLIYGGVFLGFLVFMSGYMLE